MSAAKKDSSAQKHIFVLNDEPAILVLLQEILEDEGHRVTLDTFGRIGVREQYERIAAEQPDLVVLDFLIGREPLGWQLLQALKLRRDTQAIPVVACTAAVEVAKELYPHLSEMNVIVVLKPFDIDQIINAVRRALNAGDEPWAIEKPQ